MTTEIKTRIEAVRRGEVPEGYSIERAMLYPNDWGEPVPLNTVLTENKDRNEDLRFGKDDVLSVSGEQGVVNQIELLGRSYAGESVAPYHVVETGDVVYTKSPLKENPYGIIKQNRGAPGIVSTLYAVYHCNSPITGQYLENYFCIDTFLNNYLKPLVKRGAKNDMKVNNEEVLLGRIPLPSLHEQERINEILAQFDRVIEMKQQLLEEKRRQKQWLMQKLLDPNSGVRLPGFQDSEWTTCTIKDVAKIKHGQNQHDIICDGGVYPILASGGEIGRTNTYLYNKPSVLIGRKGSIDKPVFMTTPFWTVDTLFYSEIYSNIEPLFLYYIFSSINWWQYNESTGVPSLSAKTIEQIQITCPKLMSEQLAISNILQTADREIDGLMFELEAWKQKKKAMMQLLLTGLVRLNA